MGSHVVDGCGEFMPSGEEVTPEDLKCAACECHRNFHRKEIEGEPPQQYFPSKNYNITQTDNRIHSSHTQFPPPLYLHHQHHKFTTHGLTSTPSAGLIPPIMMTFGGGRSGGPAGSSSEDLNLFQSNVGGQTSVHPPLSKKRFRTKFSQEQKDKMMEFAEKLGWKIQKQDDQEVHQFCSEVGVKRQVFKVWMHNNKQAIKKKQL
ncbi:Zinc-finger homeodomain protein [Quillaja saponaria]|uniref:Zinc-finger homeodomain protein n=1 Tax=Quillaja saponaria TaxID=32244 RepID=A0AAD7L8C6_QUISA|nr:Zinc-finger homeodomain protein [Quillaja saponaria]